jgi:adenine-specific DNA-methyltransferase
MLAEGMCKLMGFRYAPSEDTYWQHGQSSENDFIYVTTQTMTRQQLAVLAEEVGPKRSLLICCAAFRGKAAEHANLTLKKIPLAVLEKCEWGNDDYSLNVANLPKAPEPEPEAPAPSPGQPAKHIRKRRGQREPAMSLFYGDGNGGAE